MVNKNKLAQGTLNAVVGTMFLVSLAIGLAVYMAMKDGLLVILWVVLAIMGVVIAATSFFYENVSDGFGPSESNYRFAAGSIMLLAGLIGYMVTYTSAGAAVTALAAISAIAILAMVMIIKNNRK